MSTLDDRAKAHASHAMFEWLGRSGFCNPPRGEKQVLAEREQYLKHLLDHPPVAPDLEPVSLSYDRKRGELHVQDRRGKTIAVFRGATDVADWQAQINAEREDYLTAQGETGEAA
jgi:hypothetical protein